MMRRRRGAIAARRSWVAGLSAIPARLAAGQAAGAAMTPRVDRVIDLVDLKPGCRYLDIGCGTAAYAHLLAQRAGLSEAPVCLDLTAGPGPVDAVAWPEHLPLGDESFDAVTCFYFLRRFDDDVVHGFAKEISRILARGGSALLVEIAPMRAAWLDRFHKKVVSAGCETVDLRGWGRLAALLTECGFDQIDLVNIGPFIVPPIPRVGVLLRRAPDRGQSGETCS